MITHLDSILETVEKLQNSCINMFPNKELVDYYQTWIDQIKNQKITDPKLSFFLKNQIDYWRPKDRKYAEYLESLLHK